jgi:hypothetical protein
MSKGVHELSRSNADGQVADAAIAAVRQWSVFRRHPAVKFWVFGVSPAVAMALVFVVACLGIGAAGAICTRCGIPLADKGHLGGMNPTALAWGLSIVTTILPATVLTFLYCGLARRLELGRSWILASCCAVALMAMFPVQSLVVSDLPGKSLWTVGLGVPPGILQCVQLLVPLAIGLFVSGSHGRRLVQEGRERASASRLAA